MIIIGKVLKTYVCLLDEIERGLFRVQHVTSLKLDMTYSKYPFFGW